MVIKKLKERIKSLSGNMKYDKIKQELEEIETINIELDHRMTKLIAENKHLKQTYKQLYDSIKSSRVRSKEQCDYLIKQVNIKFAKNSNLNAILQEKVLVITALKDNLRKLKGKTVVDEAVILHPIDPELLKINVVQIVLWYLDSGCSKHMIRDRSQLTNFVNKFLGTIKFGNDHVEKFMGYGDYQIGNVIISRVYFVEGLGHNLFSVGQFCYSDLEVAFRQHTCFIRNLEGFNLLTGSRENNLYTMSLGDMMASSPICFLSKASKTNVDPPAPKVIALIAEVVTPEPEESTGSHSSTTVDQDAPSLSKSQTILETQPPIIPNDVEEDNHDIEVAHMGNDLFFGMPILEVFSDQSSSTDSIHTIVHPDHQISQHNSKWTKDHPLEKITGQLARPVSTRL
nr:integrase, catalytic region, zinc finger, CCHC-type, peptidase aspartic, catalytic [Tanacetum cinerariifolium]